jgi:hypothetical protein
MEAGRASQSLAARLRALSTPVLLGTLGVLTVAGVAVGMVTRPATDVVLDRFDESFGRTLTGQSWAVEAGDWQVRDGELAAERSPEREVGGDDVAPGALATIDPGRADGELTVRMPNASKGSGVVFRYQDPENYWAVVAEPVRNQWWVERIVDGVAQNVYNLWGEPAVNARVRVTLAGHRLLVAVGNRRIELFDPAPTPATAFGVVGGPEPPGTRWDDLRFTPTASPPIEITATAATDGFAGSGQLNRAEPDVGWLPAGGSWSITDGMARAAQEGSSLALLPVGAPDIDVSALVDSAGRPGAGIVARYESDREHLRLVSDPAEARWVLEWAHDRDVSELASVPGDPVGQVRLVLDGTSASVQVGTERVDGVSVPEAPPGALYAGIVSRDGDVDAPPGVDDLTVELVGPEDQ